MTQDAFSSPTSKMYGSLQRQMDKIPCLMFHKRPMFPSAQNIYLLKTQVSDIAKQAKLANNFVSSVKSGLS